MNFCVLVINRLFEFHTLRKFWSIIERGIGVGGEFNYFITSVASKKVLEVSNCISGKMSPTRAIIQNNSTVRFLGSCLSMAKANHIAGNAPYKDKEEMFLPFSNS